MIKEKDSNLYMDICPHDEFCGGCIYQGMSYEEQLKTKETDVQFLLKKNNVVPDCVDAIEGCPSQYAYRNKMDCRPHIPKADNDTGRYTLYSGACC